MFPIWLTGVVVVITALLVALWPAFLLDQLKGIRVRGMSQLLSLLKEHLVRYQFARFIPGSYDGRNRISLWIREELDPHGYSGKLTIVGEDPRQEDELIIATVKIDRRLNATLEWDGRTIKYQNALYNDREQKWMHEECINQIIGDAVRLIERYKENMQVFSPQDKN